MMFINIRTDVVKNTILNTLEYDISSYKWSRPGQRFGTTGKMLRQNKEILCNKEIK